MSQPNREDAEQPPERAAVGVDLTYKSLIRVVLVAAGAYLIVRLFPVILVVVTALILAATLSPLVAWLERHRLGRGSAIAGVLVGVAGTIGLIGALTLPMLYHQLASLVERAPALQAAAADALSKHQLTSSLGESLRRSSSAEMLTTVIEKVVAYSPRVVEVVAYALTSVVLAIYLLIDRDRARGALFAVVPRAQHIRLAKVLVNLERIVGGYVRGQLVTSGAMAVVVFVVLTIARVPDAMALAVFGGVADVLPYIGPILTIGPAVLAALSRGTGVAIAVFAALAVYEELESRWIIPRVYGRALRLPSWAVILALVVGGSLLGILGALLALPVAAACLMLVGELRVQLPGVEADDAKMREEKKDEVAEELYEGLTHGAPPATAAAVAVEMAENLQAESLKDRLREDSSETLLEKPADKAAKEPLRKRARKMPGRLRRRLHPGRAAGRPS